MKRLDHAVDLMAEAVPEALKHMRAFLAYEGTNPIYEKKAKVSGVLLSSYVKGEGTQTNRMAVNHAVSTQAGRGVTNGIGDVRALSEKV